MASQPGVSAGARVQVNGTLGEPTPTWAMAMASMDRGPEQPGVAPPKRPMPVGSMDSLATKPSPPTPLWVVSKAPSVVGKSRDCVRWPTMALPTGVSATDISSGKLPPPSKEEPPR